MKQRENGFENHHIIPKSLGGDNRLSNLVKLTYREHYLCHYLLTKMCIDPDHRKSMAYAFFKMAGQGNGKAKRGINSKLHAILRKTLVENYLTGENNPFYGKGFWGKENHFFGKKHTEDSKKKIRESLVGKNIGESNHFFGKSHSEETKLLLRKKKSVPIKVFFKTGDCIEFDNRLELGEYLGKSRELGAKLVNPNFHHLHSKYEILRIEVMNQK